MKKIVLIPTQGDPIEHITEEKKWDIVFIDFKSCTILASVIINGVPLEQVPQIIAHAFNKLIKPSGRIILRMDMPDLHNKKGEDKLNLLLHKIIQRDCLEFMAQCVLPKSTNSFQIVENLLLGISKKKPNELKNKVRFISMPDKLEIKADYEWPDFDGVPFSNDIIYNQTKYSDVFNNDISDLHPWLYLPLNKFKHPNSIELGTFMKLTPSSIDNDLNYGLNHEKFVINNVKKFDLFQNYIVNKKEKFEDKNKPYYLRRIINDSSILFYTKYDSGIKTLIFLNPEYPIFINRPMTSNIEYYLSLEIKEEWKSKVDIEYIYLETRKPEFLSQFYYYESPLYSTLTLKSSTILKAKIKNLPSIETQKEKVKKEKEELFNTQENKLARQRKLLNFEKEKVDLENRLAEYSQKILTLKKEIVTNNVELKKTIDTCNSLIPSRQKEAINLLYDILPLKNRPDEETTFSTLGFGNKARIIIECVMQTLKSNNVIPSWYDNGSSINFICRENPDWSDQFPAYIRTNLPKVKFITNKYSHKGAETPSNEAKSVLNVLVKLLEWMDTFLKANYNLEENYQRWVKEDEQKTATGLKKRSDVIGVIAFEWLNKEGKKKGAWMIPFKNQKQMKTGDRISISQNLIDELGLGLGSIIKIDAIKQKYGWVGTNIKVLNDCPKNFMLNSPYYYPLKEKITVDSYLGIKE